MNRGMLIVEPLTYIRGRTIPNQYMIVDEAQNLTPHEMKTIVTRVGEGTKIVLTGDPNPQSAIPKIGFISGTKGNDEKKRNVKIRKQMQVTYPRAFVQQEMGITRL